MNDQTAFRRFVDKWVTPTTIMILFGAIIWGVQLNWQIIDNTRRIAQNEERNVKQDDVLLELSRESTKRTYIINSLERRITDRERYDAEHEKSANEYKQEIRLNTDYRKRNGQ